MDANATCSGNVSPSYAFALWNLVIRPPRARYGIESLGPSEFTVFGTEVHRKDLKLKNPRGLWLACSLFEPITRRKNRLKPPVVVYLHGNASSRAEAVAVMPTLLARGVALFCFDFAGCGRSDGEYISLGWHEREDLAAVVEYLRNEDRFSAIGLWGRSMGAVTALLHADRDPSIGAMCVDSPFSSLRELIMELAQSEHVMVKVPTWLLSAVMMVVRMRIRVLAGFDTEDLAPINHVQSSFIPSLFVSAREDTFILPHHTKTLFDAYAGDKELEIIEGDHNSERPLDALERAADFFCRAFRFGAFAEETIPAQEPELPEVSVSSASVLDKNSPQRGVVNTASPSRPSSRRPKLPCMAEDKEAWSPASEGHFPDGSVFAA